MSGPLSEKIISYAGVAALNETCLQSSAPRKPFHSNLWKETYPKFAREYFSRHVSPEYASTLLAFQKARKNGIYRPIEVQELDEQLRTCYFQRYPEIPSQDFDFWRKNGNYRINTLLKARGVEDLNVATELDCLAAAASMEIDKLQSQKRLARSGLVRA